MSDLDDYVAERSARDPEFAEAWEALEPEYQAARAIIQARIDAEMTQAELAERCGMKASNISRLESGNSVPTIRTLCRIAKGLGKTLRIEIV